MLAVAPLLLLGAGAPLGVPVADDFDFLHHALLLDRHGFFEGGGSLAFWRPLAHQVYYSILGEAILSHPRGVAALHAALLAATALLLYRVARRGWSGPRAAAAASFPLLTESARALIAWPSHFVDLGALCFAALALHEAAFRRLATALAALLAALLCKEVAIVAALLLPWMPGPGGPGGRGRAPWIAGSLLVLAVWGAAYLWVRSHAGLELPHRLEGNPEIAAVPWHERFGWAFGNSLRAVLSLPAAPAAGDAGILAGAAILLAALAVAAARRGRSWARVHGPWLAWGGAWFAAFAAGLTAIYPIWAPYRSVFGAAGLGFAAAALGAAWPPLLALLVALRATALALAPGAPPRVSPLPVESGAFIDFERIVRLQRLMEDTRGALAARFPDLPAGARIGLHHLPRRVLYAFGGDRALQLWYRDTTLRWVSFSELAARPDLEVAGIVEYQPHRAPQVALVETPAMRALLAASDRIRDADWSGALAALDRADSAQHDPDAAVFLGTVAAKRALALVTVGDSARAEREARRGLALWPDNFDSRYVLAALSHGRGRWAEAEAQLDTLLAASPQDRGAAELREQVRAARRAAGGR